MPIYEYACHRCKKFVEVITRRVPDGDFAPACPECGGRKLTRLISNFQFHLSLKSQIDQLDPKYDKMIDASSPDLSFDNLVKKYRLDRPQSTPAERKAFRESGTGLIPDGKGKTTKA
ncbi:MAG TPA: zinc ribbon domain-containing protein [Dehalococcoidia bacterium]|nr:zinc ribbon domain-containing protein [Dehalococcoidia bacterium]